MLFPGLDKSPRPIHSINNLLSFLELFFLTVKDLQSFHQ